MDRFYAGMTNDKIANTKHVMVLAPIRSGFDNYEKMFESISSATEFKFQIKRKYVNFLGGLYNMWVAPFVDKPLIFINTEKDEIPKDRLHFDGKVLIIYATVLDNLKEELQMKNNNFKWYAGIVKDKVTNDSEVLVLMPQTPGDDTVFDQIIINSIKETSGLEFRKLDKEQEINGVKLDVYSAKFTKDVKDVPFMLVDTSKSIGIEDGIKYEKGMLYIYATNINNMLKNE